MESSISNEQEIIQTKSNVFWIIVRVEDNRLYFSFHSFLFLFLFSIYFLILNFGLVVSIMLYMYQSQSHSHISHRKVWKVSE